MNCEQILYELPAYLKEELEASLQQEVATHLDVCSRCVYEKKNLEDLFSTFSKIPLIEPSERFYYQISQQFSSAFLAEPEVSTTKRVRKKTNVFLFLWDFFQYQWQARPEWCFSTLLHTAILLVLTMIYFGHRQQVPQEGREYQVSLELPKLSEEELGSSAYYSNKAREETEIQTALKNNDIKTTSLEENAWRKNFTWIASRSHPEVKKQLLLNSGIDPLKQEFFVAQGLSYLARLQEKDGGFTSPGSTAEYRIGVSALALLPFLAEGHSHHSGTYQTLVHSGIVFLMRQQRIYGEQKGLIGTPRGNYIYNHSLATYALLENYYVSGTQNKAYEKVLLDALHYLAKYKLNDGGWGYRNAGKTSNLSVSSWPIQVVSLASPLPWLERDFLRQEVRNFLEQLLFDEWKIGYTPQKDLESGFEGMLACGMYSALLIENVFSKEVFSRQTQALLTQASQVSKEKKIGENLYFWYYGTLALQTWSQKKGESWQTWCKTMSQFLIERQTLNGDSQGAVLLEDFYFAQGGSVYSTALALMSCQSPYRY